MWGASLQPSRSCFGFVQIPKVLTVLSTNAPSALFEPLKQRQHNDSQPTTVILRDQALCGERAICSCSYSCPSSVAGFARATPRKTYWYQDFFSFFPFSMFVK
jgi:hypothetical protein